VDADFLIRPEELQRRFVRPPGARALSYRNVGGDFATWRDRCRRKLAELLDVHPPPRAHVHELRESSHRGVTIAALAMDAEPGLRVPAYLLLPAADERPQAAVMAIHGHSVGLAAGCLGLEQDPYSAFALRLAEAGHRVLLPLHRGFGPLRDLAADRPGYRLDYEQSMHFSYVTDAFVHGRTVVGEHVEDLLRWEHWLARAHGVVRVSAVGLSYGGDLALTYPVFSDRVDRIFASGSSGSFALHFGRCYNGPAHCVPGILRWMDRADVAGLNAPRPLAIHYGELDTPSLNEGRPENYAAAYNEAVPELIRDTRQIYAAAGAGAAVQRIVTPNVGHVMDVEALLAFLAADR
jgi:dienelactone hydrolase